MSTNKIFLIALSTFCYFRAILHNEEKYPDPETFKPARFLDSKGQLREDVPDASYSEVFGFGRRKCPGRYFALDVIWLAIANILTAFSIEKPVDESGNIIEPTSEYTSGLVMSVTNVLLCQPWLTYPLVARSRSKHHSSRGHPSCSMRSPKSARYDYQ